MALQEARADQVSKRSTRAFAKPAEPGKPASQGSKDHRAVSPMCASRRPTTWVASFYALAFGGLLADGRVGDLVRPRADVPPRDRHVRAGLNGTRVRPRR